MKYKSKSHLVNAAIYEPGMEDAHVLNGYQWLPYLLRPIGHEIINEGWWIITFNNGYKIQISPELFESIYEGKC